MSPRSPSSRLNPGSSGVDEQAHVFLYRLLALAITDFSCLRLVLGAAFSEMWVRGKGEQLGGAGVCLARSPGTLLLLCLRIAR